MKTKLPKSFKPLLWSYKFSKVNPDKDIERIIVNSVNYGDWLHWQWLADYYGKEKVKQVIETMPASEFRKRALKLISLLFNIKKLKYASRGAKIRAEKSIF